MEQKSYSISEAASMVEVETHVLRYWEEELEINIRRNDMGHRCYDDRDVKILQRVKILKDKGIQLKAIKDMVHRMYEMLDQTEDGDKDNKDCENINNEDNEHNANIENSEKEISEIMNEDNILDIKSIDMIRVKCEDKNRDNNKDKKATNNWAEEDARIVDFKMAQFQNLMDKIVSNSIKENIKMITQSVSGAVTEDVVKQMDLLIQEKEEQEEARYRKLDTALREIQQTRQEIAASEVGGRKKGFFRKRKK